MHGNKLTDLGGPNPDFQNTHWTQILAADTRNDARRRAIVGQLLQAYWKPVYCYLRRRGYANEAAKDLVQGFFTEVVLGRDLIQRAQPGKGRFRTFLLTALRRYVISVHRSQTAQKRRPDAGVVSLADVDWRNVRAWAETLLEAALAELEQECLAGGQAVHWELFRERHLEPITSGAEPAPLDELCDRYGIVEQRRAWNMLVTVRRKFQAILRRRLRPFVESDEGVEHEIRELIEIFSENPAS
ncbi:MAG: hypothetical protein R6V58_17690 [Planctomycetota bacterium]